MRRTRAVLDWVEDLPSLIPEVTYEVVRCSTATTATISPRQAAVQAVVHSIVRDDGRSWSTSMAGNRTVDTARRGRGIASLIAARLWLRPSSSPCGTRTSSRTTLEAGCAV